MIHPDRRTFISHAFGAGALIAAAPATAMTQGHVPLPPKSHGAVLDEAYWGLVKESFPLSPGLVLMNAANLCPSPFVVQEAVFEWTRDVDADASFQNRAKFSSST